MFKEHPGNLNIGMVGAEEPPPCQMHSAWNLHYLNDMTAALEPRQQSTLMSCPSSHFVTSSVGFPGASLYAKPDSRVDPTNGVHTPQNFPSHVASLWPATGAYMRVSQNAVSSNRFGVKPTPTIVVTSCQKQFLIFDRSGNKTRMIASPFQSHLLDQFTLGKCSIDAYNMHDEIVGGDKVPSMELLNEENVGENIILSGESEMHEDTEEINALLYSDDSDEEDHFGSDDEDDEVMSTGHSPLKPKSDCDKDGEFLKAFDEVASSDGSSKRQKLLSGGHKSSSLVNAASSMKLSRSSDYGDDDDAESTCGAGKILSQDMDSVASARDKKVKIREALKVLEAIVPSLKGNDPMLIIDGAIDYLKCLKCKAETLGVCDSQFSTYLK